LKAHSIELCLVCKDLATHQLLTVVAFLLELLRGTLVLIVVTVRTVFAEIVLLLSLRASNDRHLILLLGV
jgi:hypothetical protein